jgi:hypothetical protein
MITWLEAEDSIKTGAAVAAAVSSAVNAATKTLV